MSHPSRSTIAAAHANVLALLHLRTMLASSLWRRKSTRTGVILDELGDAQLKDIGIERWSGQRPRPSIRVEPGLIANLMSMR